MDIIKLRVQMKDNKGILIPMGVVETCSVEIADEVAMYSFKDGRTCKRFALTAIELDKKKKGESDTVWIERLQKALTRYKGKTKEQIRDELVKVFESWGGKVL